MKDFKLKGFKLKLEEEGDKPVGLNPKHIGQHNKLDREKGSGEEEAHKYKSGYAGNKTKVNHKGFKCQYTNAHSIGNRESLKS